MGDEDRTTHRDIVVIGASAGGLSALVELVRGLPHDLPAAVFVVVHTSPDNPSVLPQILARAGALPASLAVDGARIVRGHIHVAPPDHHLLLRRGHLRVARGPKENGFRPAVDPLFRTAARIHGPRVIGVVLSGGLNDGTHGLALIAQRGGVAFVQDPQEALVPSMPLSALQSVEVHHVLRAAELGPAITRRVHESIPAVPYGEEVIDVADHGDSLARHVPTGAPSPYTCPDCGGALWETSDETRVLRYRCHVGHGYTAESLAAGQQHNLDNALWTALRALEEHASLYRRMATRTADAGLGELARRYRDQVDHTERRAATIREALAHHPHSHHDDHAPQEEPP